VKRLAPTPAIAPALARVITQLRAFEDAGDEGTLTIARGAALHVSSLDKLIFPDAGITKGDIMRYYALVSPFLLPLMKDRALSLKRFPNGVPGEFFFQQKAPSHTPPSVRVETIESKAGELQERLIGGSLATLLYCTQLGAFEVNPWNARVTSLVSPDFTVIDLDPGPRTPFARVVETARWVKEALDAVGLHGGVKTSGSTGIHVFIPLPANSTEQTAEILAQHIAQMVVEAHPTETTLERSIKGRGGTKVYVDFGQNSRGKTIASAYSVRAKPSALVSTPLTWDELTASLDPTAFTVETLPQRLAKVGDIWGPVLKRRNSVRSVTKA
jgi:bifunctional non-homologous end joining protein LigD